MKARAFLELVGKTLTAQQDYFKARKAGKVAYDLLNKSKELEKQVMAVVDEGRLEPDEPLDFVADVRPTEVQANLFQEFQENEQ
ncbi:MAG: hypothetical protein EHM40_03305 [Chloroflexi bacterium]|nr:MAG: hypothetical protein EHM40_03305 [Chloroflexota bacterium]